MLIFLQTCSPGEIRNQIYSLVLIEEEPIRATLLYATKTFYSIDHPKYYTKYYGMHEVPTSPGRPAIKALGRLGWINHAVRHEARAHFYANNNFIIHGYCTTFLRAIGPVGRASITYMEFRQGSTNGDIFDRDLVRLVNECVNVKTLKISCDVALTYQGNPWETGTTVVKMESSNFIDTLKGLENLDPLKIALAVRFTMGSLRPLPLTHCRFPSAFSDLPKLASVFLQALNISYPGKDVELNIESLRITTRGGMLANIRKTHTNGACVSSSTAGEP